MYIREKHFKNKDGTKRTYLNLVECEKIDGKVVQNNLVNFGRIGQPETLKKLKLAVEALLPLCDDYSIIDPSKDLSPEVSLQHGMELVFKRQWNELGLGKILKQYMEQTRAEYNVTEAIFNMVLNRLISPTSKMKMTDFQDTVYGMEQFEIQNYYRAMDYLIEYKDEIEKAVFERMKEYAGGKVDVALFDTTTVVYYGKDSEEESELLNHGFSKAKRSDLKQVVIGVVMSKEGIPLAHEVFPGNKNDVSCCKEIIEKLKTKFSIDRIILVGDRGMISKVNIAELEKNNYEYILGYRMRTIPKEDRKKILKKLILKK